MSGYYHTPNNMIPYNDREPGEIADIAIRQLAPYREAALTWPIDHTYRDGRSVNLCHVCEENIWFDSDSKGQPYLYDDETIQTLIVAHIRQVHSEIVNGDETATRPEMSMQTMPE